VAKVISNWQQKATSNWQQKAIVCQQQKCSYWCKKHRSKQWQEQRKDSVISSINYNIATNLIVSPLWEKVDAISFICGIIVVVVLHCSVDDKNDATTSLHGLVFPCTAVQCNGSVLLAVLIDAPLPVNKCHISHCGTDILL